jgi:hypothetical protein
MEQRARIAFRTSQAMALGVSLSLFALLVGGVLLVFAMGGDNTSVSVAAPLAWVFAVAAPLLGAVTAIRMRMTRPLQIGVGVSAALLVIEFLVVRAAGT